MVSALVSSTYYGWVDKYAAAPMSADNEHMIVNDVGERMKNLVVRIHREALDHSFGYFKSTGASEAVKIPIDGETVKVTTKAAVGVIRGEDIFDIDMDRTFDTFDTRLSTGSRDVPMRPRRTIFPVPLTVLVAQIACVQHLINYSLLNVGTCEPNSTFIWLPRYLLGRQKQLDLEFWMT